MAVALPIMFAGGAGAQNRLPERSPLPPAASTVPATDAVRANSGTLGIISGGADGTYIRIAADLANVLDGEDLRILPTIGRGSLQNLRDIMFLRGIDIGIVQMDARDGLKAEGLQEQALSRLRYITRLYNEEIHVLASREITRHPPARGPEGQHRQGRQRHQPDGAADLREARHQARADHLRPGLLVRTAALGRAQGGDLRGRAAGAGDLGVPGRGPLPPPADPLRGRDRRGLFPGASSRAPTIRACVAEGEEVDTLAVGSILAVFNWPERSDRYKRVERFVNAFFSRFEEFLQPGRHPKWKEVSLTAEVPGWQRSKPAQDWIDAGAADGPATTATTGDLTAFMTSRGLTAPPADPRAPVPGIPGLAPQPRQDPNRSRPMSDTSRSPDATQTAFDEAVDAVRRLAAEGRDPTPEEIASLFGDGDGIDLAKLLRSFELRAGEARRRPGFSRCGHRPTRDSPEAGARREGCSHGIGGDVRGRSAFTATDGVDRPCRRNQRCRSPGVPSRAVAA